MAMICLDSSIALLARVKVNAVLTLIGKTIYALETQEQKTVSRVKCNNILVDLPKCRYRKFRPIVYISSAALLPPASRLGSHRAVRL